MRGLIFSMVPQQPGLVEKMADSLPVVAVGDKQDAMRIDMAEVNNFDAGYQMGAHLISLGHKRVCYVSTTLNKYHSLRVLRYRGLCESFKKFGTVSLITSDVDPMSELSTVEKIGRAHV